MGLITISIIGGTREALAVSILTETGHLDACFLVVYGFIFMTIPL